jgi:CheY-like chemotaxis protein
MQKIAVIEDVQDNRDFLYYLLRDEFNVVRYGSGEEALRGLKTDVPDLIVLDIWLDGMDGVKVLEHIRLDESLRRLPVVALTANAMLGDREKYLRTGFDEYISKPIMDVSAFISTVHHLIATRLETSGSDR